jgi:hypothetical protein
MKFLSIVLKTKLLKDVLNESIQKVYEESEKYDLKLTPRLTLTSINKIIKEFSKVDIYPGILSSAEDIGISDDIIYKFKQQDLGE